MERSMNPSLFDYDRTPISSALKSQGIKRTRQEISLNLIEDSTSSNENSALITMASEGGKTNRLSKSSALRLQVEVDELKSLTEQQKNTLERMKSEHALFRESSAKQLTFLEEQNKKLRKDYELQAQKLVEDKKKYRVKIQQLENEKEVLTHQVNSKTAALKPTIQSVEQLNSVYEKELTKQVSLLQKALTEKQEEVKKQITKSLELETTNYTLEKEIFLLKQQSRILPDDIEEFKEYKERYAALETQYRQQSRTVQEITDKMKNQHLLEDELSTLRNQYRYQNTQLIKLQQQESHYYQLQEEIQLWTDLLQDVISKHNTSNTITSIPTATTTANNATPLLTTGNTIVPNVTPTQVRQMISSLQEKYFIQQRQYSDVQQAYLTAQQQIASYQSNAQEQDIVVIKQTHEIDHLTHQIQLLQKQITTSYQPEIHSLRELIKTFDTEAKLKCNQRTSSMMSDYQKSKEEQIVTLRNQLDTTRQEYALLSKEFNALKATAAPIKLPSAGVNMIVEEGEEAAGKETEEDVQAIKVELQEVQEKYHQLQEDYQALQEYAGVDYLPHKTQVSFLFKCKILYDNAM